MTVYPPTQPMEALMPTVEFAALPTMQLPRVDALCAYCEIKLSAIPDQPVPVFVNESETICVHPCCAEPYRITKML